MQQALNVLVLGSIYTLFAVGLSLAWGIANVLNLAHGAVFVTGAVVAYVLGNAFGPPLYLLMPLVMLVGGLVTVLIDVLAFTPIARRARSAFARELAVLMASLGAAGILTNIADYATGSAIVPISPDVFTVRSYTIAGLSVTDIQVITVVFGVAVTVAMAIWVKRSPYGRALRAVAYDDRVTPLFGINGRVLSRATLFLSGALAGAAGLLLAILLSGFNAYSGDSLLLKAFAVIIVGGIGSVTGTAVAAFGLAAVETVAFVFVSGQIQDAIAFAVILLVLLLRPNGVMGAISAERV